MNECRTDFEHCDSQSVIRQKQIYSYFYNYPFSAEKDSPILIGIDSNNVISAFQSRQ